MRRIALLSTVVGIFLAASVAHAAPYLLTWDEEKQAYHLELTFSDDEPNGPDVEKTDNFLRDRYKWYQNRADGRTAYGVWSFELEDGKNIGAISFVIDVTQNSMTNSRQESYFSTDPTIQQESFSGDPRYHLGDVRTDALIGLTNQNNGASGAEHSYNNSFTGLDATTAYFLHWFRDLNTQSDLTSLRKIEVTATAVPEPGTLMLLGIGASAVFLRKKRS